MDNVAIRDASEKDIPLILRLLYELGRPKAHKDSDVDMFRNFVTKYIKDPDKVILVAQLDDVKIVGMISMMYLQRLNQTTLEMYVPELVVLKQHQNHGIGKKLINHCIAIAKEKNCHRIRLESGSQRKNTHEFYKSLDFEQYAYSFKKNLN
jgi:ribosomal protein S18 acetylase RimI-like enzyme